MYDFRRTIKEIVDVVKVCETTLRKRLTEFEDTPTSLLTIEEFMKIDLDQECDPPCYTAGLKKKKVHELEVELKKKMIDDFEDEIQDYQDKIDGELESSRPRLKGIYAAYTQGEVDDPACVRADGSEVRLEEEEERDEEEEDEVIQAVAKHFGKEMGDITLEALVKLEKTGPKKEKEEEDEGQGVPTRKAPSLASILGTMPTAATLGLPESISSCIGDSKENGAAADSGELDLSGIDDSEIELYLLSDQEVKIKTALWMAENSDYLKEQKEKEAKIAKEKELGIYKERKPKSSAKRRAPIRASTADEAIEKMLEQKKISSKINYQVLKDLNGVASSPARGSEPPGEPPAAATRLTARPRNAPRAQLSLSMPLSTLGKRLQPFISGQPSKKAAVEQVSPGEPDTGDSKGPVLVESGPVVYDEGVADEEEEEEEDTCVSAMELMGGEDYGCDDYDDGF